MIEYDASDDARWEEEARKASRVLAEEAKDADSVEARTLRLLDASLEECADEWVWQEES